MNKYTISLEKLGMNDVPIVGGKNASLGEMLQNLGNMGVKVPGGFATTADAYREFLSTDNLDVRIADRLKGLDINDVLALQQVGADIRDWIMQVPYPESMEVAIDSAYAEAEKQYGSDITWAVRSSATAEDLPNADGSYYADGSCYADGSDQIKVIHEVFLDRQYIYEHNSLSLKSRKKPNALITNTDDAIKQYQNFINGFLVIDGKEHKVKSDTGCIHSDSDNALKLIRAIKSV